MLRQAPPLPFLAPEWHGKHILALAMCWSGDIAEGERRDGAAARRSASRSPTWSRPTRTRTGRRCSIRCSRRASRNYWKSHDFLALSDGLIDVLLEYAGSIPDPNTEIAFAQVGGAVCRVPADATAYTHRDAQYVMNVHGRWADPDARPGLHRLGARPVPGGGAVRHRAAGT